MIKVACKFHEQNKELLINATGQSEQDMDWWLRNAYSPDGKVPYMISRFDEEKKQFKAEGNSVVSATFFETNFQRCRDRGDGGEINSDLNFETDWVEVERKS